MVGTDRGDADDLDIRSEGGEVVGLRVQLGTGDPARQVEGVEAVVSGHGVPRLLLGGGVIANRRLRDVALERAAAQGVTVRIPPLSLCTDNGAMIAGLAAELIASGRPPSTLAFGADSTLPVTEIQVAESDGADGSDALAAGALQREPLR